jgi:menaquinone reductase, multiheme cytochrome c subunit
MTTHEQGQAKRSHADWLLFVVGFALFSAIGFWATPAILYAEKPQPFQFSHKTHMEQVSEGCKSCHGFRDDGSFTGIPNLDKCKECHGDSPQGNSPEEKVFVEEYLSKDKPVPWHEYAKQPACVFFSHAAHAENAGLECKRCHGDHGETDQLRPYEYNRLTGYSRDLGLQHSLLERMLYQPSRPGEGGLATGRPPIRLDMLQCQDCHKQNGVRDACFVCHK